MIKDSKRFFGIASALAILVNLILFLIFYIPNYILEADSTARDYASYFFTRLVEFILPTLSAVLIFIDSVGKSPRSALIGAIWLSLPRFIYLFPYYYLYETAYGSDWIESILISLLINLLIISIYWLHVVLIYLVILYSSQRLIKREIIGEYPKSYAEKIPDSALTEFNKRVSDRMLSEVRRDGIFNFDLTVTFAIMLGCIAEFVYRFVLECVDAISYLAEYAGTYRSEEIVYMIFSFAFIVLEVIIAHLLCCLTKKLVIKKCTEETPNEVKNDKSLEK